MPALVYKTDNGNLQALSDGDTVTVPGNIDITGNLTWNSRRVVPEYFIFVESKEDFPAAVDGVRTLEDNKTYYITTNVDLEGDRLVGGVNTVLQGSSSENSVLSSTGLSGTALITTNYALPMQHITITAEIGIDFDASATGTQALDWFGVNFTDCGTVGNIKGASNFILKAGALINSGGLSFDGTIGTVGFDGCLLSTPAGEVGLTLKSTATITRRLHAIYSAVIAPPTATAFLIEDTAALTNNETFILDTINFAGGGTYISGVDEHSIKTLWKNNTGIANSVSAANFYMIGNATATTFSAANTFTKILGTTTVGTYISKFSHTNNRVTYTGNLTRLFKFAGVVSMSGGARDVLSCQFALNGAAMPQTESKSEIGSIITGRIEGLSIHGLIQMSPGDYVEVFIANRTDTTSATITDLNVVVIEVGS